MATKNPFDLLGDDDNDDPSQLIAKKALAPITAPPSQQQPKPQGKLPSKPAPPAQAVRDAKSEGRGGGRGGGDRGGYARGERGGYPRGGGGDRGFDRGERGGGRGFNRDRVNNENSFSNNGLSGGPVATEEGGDFEKSSERRGAGYGGPRGGGGGGGGGSFRGESRGGRRGGFSNGEFEREPSRRVYERRSGTGRGNELKREGSGKGNWGSAADEIAPENEDLTNTNEKNVTAEKQPGEEEAVDASKENPVNEPEEKEPEEKEMTLDEYQKVLEEKRKALLALKVEERKVDLDKDLKKMQLLSSKKTNDDVFIKLGSDKEKRKEIADKDEKAKKAVSISEFLKPAEGERYYNPGGRGRGRGRGGRGGGGGFSGGAGGGNMTSAAAAAPSIADPGEFPNLMKK